MVGKSLWWVGVSLVTLAGVVLGESDRSAGTAGPRARPATRQDLPVFPGAEGFGTRTRAGRGGKVIAVTTLADSGPGSLREALLQPMPRVVVFRVGGTITLRESLFVSQPFVTVAGQTAPGDGIQIRNAGVVITTHDVLIQHLRIRPGNEGRVDPATNDAIEVLGRHGEVSGAWNVVLDHVSASWSEDETVSTWYGAYDVTLSWCIVSEALNISRHPKKTHSAGLLVGDGSDRVSVHHCLLAHNDFRNPLVIGGGTHDFTNNVIYDWGVIPGEVVDSASNTFLNFVGNYFVRGPAGRSEGREIVIAREKGRADSPRIYVRGNLGPSRPTPDGPEWAVVGNGYGDRDGPPECRAPKPFATAPVRSWSAAQALAEVPDAAGATLPKRDPVDARVVASLRRRTGGLVNSPEDVGGYPVLRGGTPPADSDGDGMSDAWERSQGLDPRDPADGAADRDKDGYTNLEEYLHSLGAAPARRGG